MGEPEEEELGGLDDGDDESLILISSEDDSPREFEISRKAALMCNLVKSILEGDANAKKIPIKKVRGDILELIVEYLKHHMVKNQRKLLNRSDRSKWRELSLTNGMPITST